MTRCGTARSALGPDCEGIGENDAVQKLHLPRCVIAHRLAPPPSTTMSRLIKRYGSRKLYDTSESRYVSLDEVAAFVRDGQDVHVVENKTGDDVTAAILTQIISEEGRAGRGLLSAGFLHDLLRAGESALKIGEQAVGSRVQQARQGVQKGVDDLARAARARVEPIVQMTDMRDEVTRLRERLESLEDTLSSIDTPADAPASPNE